MLYIGFSQINFLVFKDLYKKFKSIILRNGDILLSQGDKTGDGNIIQFGKIF